MNTRINTPKQPKISRELAVRLPGFIDLGIPEQQLMQAINRAGPELGPATSGWSYELIQEGHSEMKKGEDAEKSGNFTAAKKAFLDASFWYFFARFPHILHEEGAHAYQLHNQAYLRANQYEQFDLEMIKISFEDKPVPAILRLPKLNHAPFPVVVIWGGIDIWKSDLEIHSLGNAFLNRGIAVLAIDMPGTGECPIPVSPDAHAWYFSVFDFLKSDARIDATKIGCYGLSFGGYWAVKLALMAPWLSGVISNGAPIHHTFTPEWLAKLPLGIKMALARVCHIQVQNNPEHLYTALSALSLQHQGLLNTSSHAPLLSINGAQDELVPIKDLYFINEQGIKQDVLVFANDRHVASVHWKLHEKYSADWMAHQFDKGEKAE